jgi:hypothetical protein
MGLGIIMNIKQEVTDYRLGNITMYKFLDTLYDENPIMSLDIDDGKIYKTINISVQHTGNINSDDIINEKLKRLSKHSRIYKFVLMHTSHVLSSDDTNITNYIINSFKKNKFKKPNPSGPSTLSISTVESMLGLSKHFYHSVVHKVCNNGDRYIFNVNCNFFDLDISGTVEELRFKMQKVASKNGYYAKVFCDDNSNLNVIITRKKSYHHGKVPKITKQHIYNILGVNQHYYSDCIIVQKDNKTIFSIGDIRDNTFDVHYSKHEIFKRLKNVFENHYIVELRGPLDVYEVSISFTPIDNTELSYIQWLDENINKIVPLSVNHYDRIEALKNKAETLEERCERYTPQLQDNEHLDVSQQLTKINNLLKNISFL